MSKHLTNWKRIFVVVYKVAITLGAISFISGSAYSRVNFAGGAKMFINY